LQPDLYEVQAWWFYENEMYDSAAVYLEKALPNAGNKQEVARWEYLIAQLYERSNHADLAIKFYDRSIKHTLNPILEVYATLNSIRQHKSDSIAIQRSLNELLKMTRKGRYTNYRDIIYYTAAQVELERNNIAGAKALLLKATESQGTNPAISQRTKAFLLLGDLSYEEKKYLDAKRYYDSIVNNDPAIENPDAFENKKTLLTKIALQTEIIEKQDSLQRIASLTEAEREEFIRKLVKKLRKEQGLREEESVPSIASGKVDNRDMADLFDNRSKGEWYFYNPALKSRGYTEFKGRWGNRPNEDNWRRISAVTNRALVPNTGNEPGLVSSRLPGGESTELSYEAMLKNVPLTPMQLNASNDLVQSATMDLSTLYMDGLEDYPTVIETLEGFLERFPNATRRSQALFQLYYSYTKTGDREKADNILKLLQEKYPGTEYEKLASNSKNGITSDPVKNEMTATYDSIYNLFIEGRFDEALAQKKQADSMYSTNYWTPQLLYIESIYHIRQRNDSTARATLQQITRLYPASPMAGKAQTMIDVLNRRHEIESYLTNLQITRPIEDSASIAVDTLVQKPVVVNQPPPTSDPKPPLVVPKVEVIRDTIQTQPLPVPTSSYTFDPSQPHSVVIVMDRVDGMYVSESKNAFNRYNKEKFYNQVIDINNMTLNDSTKLVVMTSFENAATGLDYLEKTRKVAAREIVPWLPAGKYHFILISLPNLEILKTTKDMQQYRKFLLQSFPGKFDELKL
jgi:TolA-binding protein